MPPHERAGGGPPSAWTRSSSAPSAARPPSATGIDQLLDRLTRDEFDLVAIGRALLGDPAWADKVRTGHADQITPFDLPALRSLT